MLLTDNLVKEEKLEPIARYFRFRRGLREIKNHKYQTLVDLGCGPSAPFYNFAMRNHIKIDKYIGIDPLLKLNQNTKNSSTVMFIKKDLTDKIPLADKTADCIVGFAFFEHLDHPEKIIQDTIRVLKIGGKAIFTMPSIRAKGLLDFLSSQLNLISKREIEEHKNYFDKKSLLKLIGPSIKFRISHSYFEFGLNNIIILEKMAD